MAFLKIKQGESFTLNGRYLEDDGITSKSLDGVTLKSQIRLESKLISTLTVTVLNSAEGTYRLDAVEGTANWPVGTLSWDIKERVLGVDRLTETHQISVKKAVTI